MEGKEEFANRLGENIKRFREARNLTLQELADKVGISVSYLNRLENSERKSPSLSLLVKLREIFDITVDSLLFDDDRVKDNGVKDILQDMGLSTKEAAKLEEIINFIILIDWSKQEERIDRMFDLSLKIDNFKKVKLD